MGGREGGREGSEYDFHLKNRLFPSYPPPLPPSLTFYMQQRRQARPVDIEIEQPHSIPLPGERKGKIDGDGAFAHPSFTGRHGHDMLHVREA